MQQQNIARVVEVLDAEQLPDARDAVLGERHRAHLLVDGVVVLAAQPRDDAIDDVVGVGGFLGCAGVAGRRDREL